MITLINQDRDEVIEATQIFYRKHYYKKNWFTKKQFMGFNLYANDLKGKERLLGTFDTEEEAIFEIYKINNTETLIKYVTIYE
jgi:hypothetical protein